MMAEQHLNAGMVVEEIKIGLRVETVNGLVRGFVKSEGLRKMVVELMEGERGREAVEKEGARSWGSSKKGYGRKWFIVECLKQTH